MVYERPMILLALIHYEAVLFSRGVALQLLVLLNMSRCLQSPLSEVFHIAPVMHKFVVKM